MLNGIWHSKLNQLQLPKQVELLKTPCYNQINKCGNSKMAGAEGNET